MKYHRNLRNRNTVGVCRGIAVSFAILLTPIAQGSTVVLDFDSLIFGNSLQNNSVGTSIGEDGFIISAPADIWVYGTSAAAYSGDPALFISAPNSAITIATFDNSPFDLLGFTLSEATVNVSTIVLFEAVYANATTSPAVVTLDGNAAVPQAFIAGTDFDANAFSNLVGLRFLQVNPGYQINSITLNASVPEPSAAAMASLLPLVLFARRHRKQFILQSPIP